jgi:hypothetical protein
MFRWTLGDEEVGNTAKGGKWPPKVQNKRSLTQFRDGEVFGLAQASEKRRCGIM